MLGAATAQAACRINAGRERWEVVTCEDLWGGGAAQQCAGERPTWHGTRGAHLKHPLHRCDAGRVETQRLVERRRFLPSRKEGTMRGEVRDGRREGGAAARRKRRARGRARLEGLGRRKLAERT